MEDAKVSRKRRRISDVDVDLSDTKFGAVRRLLQELRPYILEVIASPDYYNCRATPIVRKGIKQVKEFCKQLRAETVLLAKQKKASDGLEDHINKRRQEEVPIFIDDPGDNPLVGGSPYGWNFILFRNQGRKVSML
eukprot:c18895_g1_i2 orf=388-795(-)